MAKKSPKKPTKAKAAAKKKSPAKHCCGVIITYACPLERRTSPKISAAARRSGRHRRARASPCTRGETVDALEARTGVSPHPHHRPAAKAKQSPAKPASAKKSPKK